MELVAIIVGGVITIITTLIAQAFLHRRWAVEQDSKRDEIIAQQANERRQEQQEFLQSMSEQTKSIISNAISLAETHREDAERARLMVIEASNSHIECMKEVSVLKGSMDELRIRLSETERTSGYDHKIAEQHREIKHEALNALAGYEGYVALVRNLLPSCTCEAFKPLEELTNVVQPRMNTLLEKNRHIQDTLQTEKSG